MRQIDQLQVLAKRKGKLDLGNFSLDERNKMEHAVL